MTARSETKTITKRHEPEEPAQEQFGQRKRPEKGPFRLQVDRQTKESYATYEAAVAAGLEIKKRHPIVQVSVYDSVEYTETMVEVPAASS